MGILSERNRELLSRGWHINYLFGEANSADLGGWTETEEKLGAGRIIKECGCWLLRASTKTVVSSCNAGFQIKL